MCAGRCSCYSVASKAPKPSWGNVAAHVVLPNMAYKPDFTHDAALLASGVNKPGSECWPKSA